MHTCADLIASVPFLEDAEDDFVRYLVTQLHPTVCKPSHSLLFILAAMLCMLDHYFALWFSPPTRETCCKGWKAVMVS